MTEAHSGSDVANMETLAQRRGGQYWINGEKTFISNGGIADFYVLFARTGAAPGARGVSAFIVAADAPGLHTAERIDVIAPRSDARRVRNESVSTCRPRWAPYHDNNKTHREPTILRKSI